MTFDNFPSYTEYPDNHESEVLTDILWKVAPEVVAILLQNANAHLTADEKLAFTLVSKLFELLDGERPTINTEVSRSISEQFEEEKVLEPVIAGGGRLDDGLPTPIAAFVDGTAKITVKYDAAFQSPEIEMTIALQEVMGDMFFPDDQPSYIKVTISGDFTNKFSESLGDEPGLPKIDMYLYKAYQNAKFSKPTALDIFEISIAARTFPDEKTAELLLNQACFKTDGPVLTSILEGSPIVAYFERLYPAQNGKPEYVVAQKEVYRPLGTHLISNWGPGTRLFFRNSREREHSVRPT